VSREIKFRAWDGKKMKYEVFPTGDNSICYWIGNPDVELNFHDSGSFKWKIMQFTGLHDKNGKEIWEGDILKWEYWPYEDHVIENIVVEYKNGRFSVPYSECDTIDSIEVIGNIYDNPELIREVK